MSRERADETHSVRLPSGMADQVRAATGQPLSRIVRWQLSALLDKIKAEGGQAQITSQRESAQSVVEEPKA